MAQELWQDADGLVIPSTYPNELRMLLIAQRQGQVWTAIYTARGDAIRIISVRRARDNERSAYYEQ